MPKGRDKGFAFERKMCKILSEWWTDGKSDDIFWRSASSGGRATHRAKSGKSTAGSHGDIAAVDPIGNRLTKLFAIELKRGKSHGEPGDLLDCKASPDCHKWIATMEQALASHWEGKTHSWLIIVQRDFRNPAVFFESRMCAEGQPLFHARKKLLRAPAFSYKLKLPTFGNVHFIGISLEKFLASVKPSELGRFGR